MMSAREPYIQICVDLDTPKVGNGEGRKLSENPAAGAAEDAVASTASPVDVPVGFWSPFVGDAVSVASGGVVVVMVGSSVSWS